MWALRVSDVSARSARSLGYGAPCEYSEYLCERQNQAATGDVGRGEPNQSADSGPVPALIKGSTTQSPFHEYSQYHV
jgi:hypothetical protein